MKQAKCPDEAGFLAYTEGSLAPQRRAQLESHLESCADCREFLSLYTLLAEEGISAAPEASEPMPEDEVKKQTARILAMIEKDDAEQRGGKS